MAKGKEELKMEKILRAKNLYRQEIERSGKDPKDLTKNEKQGLFNKAKRAMAIAALSFGILGATGCSNALPEAKAPTTVAENRATDQEEINKTSNARDNFVVQLKTEPGVAVIDANKEEEEILAHRDEIIKDVENDIRDIKTPDEALDYVKDLYVREYNKINNTEYLPEQVEFYRQMTDYGKYHYGKYTAENGEKIYRRQDDNSNIDISKGVIIATIHDEDKDIVEMALRENHTYEYKTVYHEDEKVDYYKPNILTDLGYSIDAAIEYREELRLKEENKSYDDIREERRQRYINKVAYYKAKKDIELDNKIEAESKGFEIGE